ETQFVVTFMEYVDGGPLMKEDFYTLMCKPMSQRRAKLYFIQMLQGLQCIRRPSLEKGIAYQSWNSRKCIVRALEGFWLLSGSAIDEKGQAEGGQGSLDKNSHGGREVRAGGQAAPLPSGTAGGGLGLEFVPGLQVEGSNWNDDWPGGGLERVWLEALSLLFL
ncbi:MAG: hypothetical protein QF615_14445, partial [Planctomycetota bacterium]|nr:hypothetical protein [Planctomycetota bacterium]